MRIPCPTSIPTMPAFIFLGTLLAVQLIEGTDPMFALLMMAAQFFAVLAFNTLGGMSHVAGSFCLFSLLPNVTVPEIAHAIVLQPGDFNIPLSLEASAVCAIFYGCFYAVSRFVILLPVPKPYLDRVNFSLIELRAVSAVAAISAFFIMVEVLTGREVQNGTTLSALVHFYPVLTPLSVVLATHVRLKSTHGKSAINWYVLVILILATVPGFLSASKEGMLTPFFCWLIVCAIHQYSFSRTQVAVLAGLMVIVWLFIYPYSQSARVQVRSAETLSDKFTIMVEYFTNPSEFPNEAETSDPTYSEYGESSTKLSIIQRFSLLRSNGMLVNADESSGFTGIDRYLPAFFELVPHFIWPDRPDPISSNELGHKAGFRMSRRDTTTGIAMASPGLFYDVGGWLGLVVLTLMEFGFFFYALRCMVGKSTESAWGLMLVGSTAFIAGAAFPSTPIEILLQFVMVFGVLVFILKTVAYISETLITRPVTQ